MTKHRRPRFRFDFATAIVCALGLLFWARLIVITDMPRTAVADEMPPDEPEASASDNNGDRPAREAIAPDDAEATAGAEMADRP